MTKKEKVTPTGTMRIKARNLKPYKKTSDGWKLIKEEFPEAMQVIKLFKAEKRFNCLIDTKDPRFLKGQLSKKGEPQGARIDILPNGKKLEKAYSLFSPHLKIHDQVSHDHWDVIYKNKGGTYSYVYTLEKRKEHMAKKYRKVDEFEKHYQKLKRNVKRSLLDISDMMAAPMHTLLNTYMRVGNETYYKAHGHKGLTTLTKKDVNLDGNKVVFDYIGKDGVPIKISQNFIGDYINRLKQLLRTNNGSKFIFNKNGSLLHENDFKAAFLNYCGQEFYPHIVRSHYATMKVKKFLKNKKKVSKGEVERLFLQIAHDLGHKKFNKKNNEWQENYNVTVNCYIQPELVEKLHKMTV